MNEEEIVQRFAIPPADGQPTIRIDNATALQTVRGFQYWESAGLDGLAERAASTGVLVAALNDAAEATLGRCSGGNSDSVTAVASGWPTRTPSTN
jgi:hypothetical protein